MRLPFLLLPLIIPICCVKDTPEVPKVQFPPVPAAIQPEGTNIVMFKVLVLGEDNKWQQAFYAPVTVAEECVSVYWTADGGVMVTPIACGIVGDLLYEPGHNVKEQVQ